MIDIKSVSIVLYSSLCSRTLRSLRALRFNYSNPTGIDMTIEIGDSSK